MAADDRPERRQGRDPVTLMRHFGVTDALPMWIAEPDVDLLPELVEALEGRAARGWYGYEIRPDSIVDAFSSWVADRHGWTVADLAKLVSPSVGTSIGVAIDVLTTPGDGVIIQPPVFTDFKPIIVNAGRTVVRSPLVETDAGTYRMDFDHLAAMAAEPTTRMMILCNPHNPVGRVWTTEELRDLAAVCAEHDVFVLADEVHADLALAPHRFVPFGTIAGDSGVRWAATHGPIKTFGLAGVCDTLLLTADEELSDRFTTRSRQLHLTRNHAFGLAAFEAAYRSGGPWLDAFLGTVAANLATVRAGLPDGIRLVEPEGTYLAWLDLRLLDLPIAEIGSWLAREAGVAASPGHWFGREGAGFARLTIGVRPEVVHRAIANIAAASDAR